MCLLSEFSASGEFDEEFDKTPPDISQQHYLRVRRMASVTSGVKDNYEKIMIFLSDGK